MFTPHFRAYPRVPPLRLIAYICKGYNQVLRCSEEVGSRSRDLVSTHHQVERNEVQGTRTGFLIRLVATSYNCLPRNAQTVSNIARQLQLGLNG